MRQMLPKEKNSLAKGQSQLKWWQLLQKLAIRHWDIGAMVFACVLFNYLIMRLAIYTDMQGHSKMALEMAKGQRNYGPNFLYYWLLTAWPFELHIQNLSRVAMILLGLAHGAKYAALQWVFWNVFKSLNLSQLWLWVKLSALAGFFFFAIPDPHGVIDLHYLYLGRIVPHVWHNSTSIAVFPFAILLFWFQWRIIDENRQASSRELWILTLLVLCNILIKPSFLFAYLPVTGLYLLFRYYANPLQLLRQSLPLAASAVLVGLQYLFIYQFETDLTPQNEHGISVGEPFEVWVVHVKSYAYLLLAWGLSILGPVVLYLSYPQHHKDAFFYYSTALFVVAFLISGIFIETGTRRYDGNMIWQVYICYAMVVINCIRVLGKLYIEQPKPTIKLKLVSTVFAVHILTGMVYPIRILLTGDVF